MFRRSTALAALVAASFFLAPSAARAQFYSGGSGGFFASPASISPVYRSSYLYYQYGLPYNPVVNNTFGYGGSVAPMLVALARQASPVPTGNPVLGLSGNASFTEPFGFGGFGSYAGYPGYLYPDFGYPMGYGGLGFMNTTNVLDPLSGAFPGVPMLMDPGFSTSGLSTIPYTPGLYLNALARAVRVPTRGVEVANPKTATSSVLFSSKPGSPIRPAVGPAGPGKDGNGSAPGKEPAAGPKAPAKIEVRLPTADAKLWFQGQLTKRRGKVREFESPPLAPGTEYTYQVRASWMRDGEEVARHQTISVRAGQRTRVDFTSK
jgi:uncharacterized protein (TIGR03000 family)